MQVNTFNQTGEKIGQIKLPKDFFEKEVSPDLIHQVVTVEQKNQRRPWAHTKDRSEVRGGGKKPWRQKGTGRARHGSIRSPLWRGGGVTFGPTNQKVLAKKINRKMKRLALVGVLKEKIKQGNIIVVDDLKLGSPKTKELKQVLQKLLLSKKIPSCLILLDKIEKNLKLASRNLKKVSLFEIANLSTVKLIKPQKIIMTEKVFKSLIEKCALIAMKEAAS